MGACSRAETVYNVAMNPLRLKLHRACAIGLNHLCIAGLTVLIVLGCDRASAGTGDYLIDVWTGENGLPNSSVTALAQTPDGYLWVGTYNGLARFDGVRFVKFDPDNTPQLKRARVRRLYVDAIGTLWINTYDGSLTSYRDGTFTFQFQGDGSFDATTSMVSLRSNNIVFLLHTGELIRQRPVTGPQMETAESDATNRWQVLRPPGMSSGTLCVEDGAGVLWGRNREQRLWRYARDQFEMVPTNSGLQGSSITCVSADAKGRLWVGTDKEVARWDGSSFQSMSPTNGEPNLNVSWVYIAPDGGEWIVANERVR